MVRAVFEWGGLNYSMNYGCLWGHMASYALPEILTFKHFGFIIYMCVCVCVSVCVCVCVCVAFKKESFMHNLP